MDISTKERIDMLIAMMAAIADISEIEAKTLIESTYVYQDIVDENECVLYDSYSANLMEIVNELTRKGKADPVKKVTPDTITELNCWRDENNVHNASELLTKYRNIRTDMKSHMADLLKNKLHAFSEELQKKVSEWIHDDRRGFFENAFSQHSARFSTVPQAVGGVRGAQNNSEKSTDIEVSTNDEKIYDFVLKAPVTSRFTMDMGTDNNRKFFVVIAENGGSEFVGAYSLSKLGSHKLRTKELIQLEAGEYSMFVIDEMEEQEHEKM